ncbi:MULTISPECIES: CdaR family transcriptional regulator [unclassified Brenneria]|uniref:CdaR family transcriptional regulator n=1 Tax=unclassified Brenneria TaxID=2634434 RepID=UPI0029C4C78A|nr:MULTISPECIES: CdaR family transcriptional regulator [unclassified Brenneria]MDX5628792.1 CdaR family transcriptional regulator [Brenneria sp. L3-3Z]MDX5695931.1 CdaR family transcriptional regulator [Brenneria sp. L4-2C]
MTDYYFDAKLAYSIVKRTMDIIDCNINVMDAKGRIIGSGDQDRIGEIHEGALLALTQERIVSIDDASTHTLHGVKPGINLPLRLNNQIVGVIGLTGNPEGLLQFGELVCMTAEMMLEQAHLLQLLAQNSRLREELVLSMVRNDVYSLTMKEWAQRLGVDLQQPRVAMVVELDSGQLGVSTAMSELQQLQSLLMETGKDDLMAIVSLTEMVVLKPAYLHAERWEPEEHKRRMAMLHQRLQQESPLKGRLALGKFFPGEGGVARSYQTAKTTIKVGKRRMPDVQCYCYQDIKLPVLLDSLRDGWQATELVSPLNRLKAMDGNGVFRKTLHTWIRHNQQAGATAKALFIHKNTLEYRLRRIAELTGLNLSLFEDRFLLYVAAQLDEE